MGTAVGNEQLEHESADGPRLQSVDRVDPTTDSAESGLQISPRRARSLLLAADLAATAIGVLIVFGLQEVFRQEIRGIVERQVLLVIATSPVWPISYAWNKLYVARAVERPNDELRRIVRAVLIAVAAIVAVSFAADYDSLSRFWTLSLLPVVMAVLVVERAIARQVFVRLRRSGRLRRRILIVGTGIDACALAADLGQNHQIGYEVCGFLSERHIDGGVEVLGSHHEAERVLDEQHAIGVIISPGSIDPAEMNNLTRRLTDGGYHVALSSGLRDIDSGRFRTQELNGRTMLYIEPIIRGGWHAGAKRTFDVLIAIIAILLSMPVILLAALSIKFTSRGPVLFSQMRVGLNGTSFRMYKLRTMVADAEERRLELLDLNEADGPLFKISNDPRITRVGSFLRRTSIDELPQFWNVLRGDMSIVGPRPALPHEVAEWTPVVHERLRVLPGITGIWQVSGRADTSFEDYARFDRYYVDNWSLGKDLVIVAKTFAAVVRSNGAH